MSKEYEDQECMTCKWHEEDFGTETFDGSGEYDSWCNAGMPEYALEIYECNGFDDPCPLRAALEERDKWKDKAMELWCSRHDMLNMCAYASCNYKTCPLVLKGVEEDGSVSED